ncbi:MAG: ATP-binding protein [Phycisphaerae bacterium]|nr:ATP-binding protein [Phycisphaerae bacterium]
MDLLTATAVEVGSVVEVSGNEIRLKLTPEFLEAARSEHIGQPGAYILVAVGELNVVGLINSLHFDEAAGEGAMTVQLFGQIRGDRFSRGVDQYPVIHDRARLPEEEDLAAILGGDTQEDPDKVNGHLLLGRSAINSKYLTYLNTKHFFSKHVAVLGNSGAGKSCTVARIISQAIRSPHSQVILFDLHGEYRQAFSDDDGKPLPNVTYLSDKDMIVPYWLLRYSELEALFVDKSDPRLIANQSSFLKEALRKLKRGSAKRLNLLESYTVDTPIHFSMEHLHTHAENMNQARFVLNTERYAFARSSLRSLPPNEQEEILLTQKAQFNQGNAEGEIPHALYYQKLIGMIDRMEHRLNDCRYDFLLRPVKHARDSKLFVSNFPQIKEEREDWSEVIDWLIRLLLGQLSVRKNLTIVDLSSIPFDIVDLTVGLLTRVVFDYNFFSVPAERRPVVMVYEESHNYIPREDKGDSFARKAVERVAKEGRKYGVSAMVVSQRPGELSHTVLSQCNNLVVMRLNNPEDQQYVTKVVSDQFADLVKMLPVLRPGEGFVIGDSVPLPMRTLVTLPERTPASADVDFVEVWSNGDSGEEMYHAMSRWFKQTRPEEG